MRASAMAYHRRMASGARSSSSKTVSIRDVAELAGVSVGSASRVINRAENVTTDTRERVERAIAQLGYRPNHAAQSLRRRSTRTIGVLLTDVTNPLYGQLFHALEESLRKAGYVTLLANSLNSAEREIDILATFGSRGMDGVIAAPGNERQREVVAALQALDVPTVILDRDMAPERDRVQFDHTPGLRHAVAYLGGLGHRRIALVVTQATTRPMQRRIEGWRAGLQALGVAPSEDMIVRLPSAMSSSYSAVSLLLARPDRPTALIAMGTNILNEALNAIAAHRLRVPEDISVIALGDPDFARSYSPSISALRVDLQAVAQQASAMLLDRLQHPDEPRPARTVKVAAELILRGSCAPAP